MRILSAALIGAACLSAAPAFAWSEHPTARPEFQPADPNRRVAIWAYPSSANYCPAGLQPVRIGGVICCGTPTHTGYRDHPVVAHRPAAPAYTGAKDGFVAYSKDYVGN